MIKLLCPGSLLWLYLKTKVSLTKLIQLLLSHPTSSTHREKETGSKDRWDEHLSLWNKSKASIVEIMMGMGYWDEWEKEEDGYIKG